MKIFKNIKVIDTAFGGYGVAKIEGNFTVFIPFVVENDIIDFIIVKKKKNYAFGKLIKIREKSTLRKNFYCKYCGICGGCTLGFIKYEHQIKIKKKIIENFFRNQINFNIDKIICSPENKRYRLRATFKVLDKKFGFFKFKSNEFIPINDCVICKSSIIEKAHSFSNFISSKKIESLYIIENEEDVGLINYSGTISDKINLNIQKIAGIKGKNFIKGENFLKISYNNSYFYGGFNTFAQSNRFLLKEFTSLATNFLNKNDNVIELYAGSGFFTFHISKIVNELIAIENNTESINLLKKLNLKNVKIINKSVIKVNYKNYKNFNTLFVDPPRMGLSKSIINMIKNHLFSKIIYVSCDPSTLARDISYLKDFYKIKKFYFIDMFPETHHIETITFLERKL